ncbi:MAG: hypothetical protein JSR93_01975 [Verrucomicrobia bacterium]|nr:hypothetical protein [Verrucomicrobiota bacterium]
MKIVSTNPLIQPKLDLGMYSDGAIYPDGGVSENGTDANLTVAAYKLIANAVGPGNVIYPPNMGSATDDELFAAAKQPGGRTIASHITGTTRMATSMATGVVDGNLRVFGVKNLMVCDLGAAPELPDGNTCYAVYVLALGAAQILGVATPPGL